MHLRESILFCNSTDKKQAGYSLAMMLVLLDERMKCGVFADLLDLFALWTVPDFFLFLEKVNDLEHFSCSTPSFGDRVGYFLQKGQKIHSILQMMSKLPKLP